MKYKKIYKNLEKGRYFYTIWCTLDKSCILIIRKLLRPILPYCKWVATFIEPESDSKNVPHITLRYLGFSDELNEESVKDDKKKFEKAIKAIKLNEITVRKINIWKKYDKGILVKAMLNWEIIDDVNLIKIHNSLLKIPRYYFFEELEGKNYHPHISLGEIDIDKVGDLEKVERFIGKLEKGRRRFTLRNFAINLASKKKREVISL